MVPCQVKVREANFYNAIELSVALSVSFMINLFVVAVFASAPEADDTLTLSSAGDFLEGKYGQAVLYIWAIGLLAVRHRRESPRGSKEASKEGEGGMLTCFVFGGRGVLV